MAFTNLDQVNAFLKVQQSDPLYQKYWDEQKKLAQLNADLWKQQHGLMPSSAGATTPSLERAVRPFLLIDSRPPVPAASRPPLPGEGTDAFISWGKRSSFIRPPTEPVSAGEGDELYDYMGGGGFRVQYPPSIGNRNKADPREVVWKFIRANFQTVKIYDPQDSANYIEVKRYEDVWFRDSEDGQTYHLTGFKWDDSD